MPESEVADSDPLEDRLFRFSFPRLHGNGVFYFVPGADGRWAVAFREAVDVSHAEPGAFHALDHGRSKARCNAKSVRIKGR